MEIPLKKNSRDEQSEYEPKANENTSTLYEVPKQKRFHIPFDGLKMDAEYFTKRTGK